MLPFKVTVSPFSDSISNQVQKSYNWCLKPLTPEAKER
jgi:hypothetical protein